MTSPALVDRVQALLARLERAQWIPQLLTRLFVGYFFYFTARRSRSSWGAIALGSVTGSEQKLRVQAKAAGPPG
jgi:hypothetical protein